MNRDDLIAAGVILAIILACVADVIAWQGRRYGARALLSAHSHRRRADPPPAPRNLAVDRRLEDRGPPQGQPERRAAHRAPDDDRARRRDVDAPRWHVVDEPLTREEATAYAEQARRGELEQPPGPLGSARGPDTDQLHPPTRDMRAIDPNDYPDRG